MGFMTDQMDELLAAYRFADAEMLIETLPGDDRESASKRLSLARLACEPAARRRSNAIQAAARNHKFETLLEIADDPLTAPLLSVLPIELQEAADIQLSAAISWRSRKIEAHVRRLEEAEDALEAFDLPLARSLIGSIEDRYLSEAGRETRDRLLLDIEARSMEADALDETARKLEAELRPKQPKRWWRR